MKNNYSGCFSILLFIFFLLVLNVQPAHATKPKSVDLSYDERTQILSVKIDHYTAAANLHHIEYVEIRKNRALLSNNEYKNQPADSTFTYTYPLPAAKGDTVEVTASCNLWGRKTSTLTIP
ncbi:MAG: hypothetical protein CVU71_16315 [Deltaproteobacteria bacterium HGW-Deltaproteobacteria-6]|jgi:desulfoferrodoxin (superoxide reductase-like protein)|nr:MAG: hypothetical protein CVU71_16315 [Deltaproteobacteria bacterium HGW-Deltaproteobacteria-6]